MAGCPVGGVFGGEHGGLVVGAVGGDEGGEEGEEEEGEVVVGYHDGEVWKGCVMWEIEEWAT